MIDRRITRNARAGGSSIAPLWRALILFRVAALVYGASLVAIYHRDLARPRAATAALVAMALWTALMSVTNGRSWGRRWWWALLDLMAATAALLFTGYVDKPDGLLAHGFTLTGPWTGASVLACAFLGGPWVGMLASLAIVVATMVLPGNWADADTLDTLVLLVLAAGSLGLVVRLLEQAEQRMRRLVEHSAATAERERLARSIHDGVLQILALVQRDGPALGERGAELARLAGTQETALRVLMTHDWSPESASDAAEVDVRQPLGRLGLAAGRLSTPATPVLLPRPAASELAAATAAAVDNARRHAGPDAGIWVAVEDDTHEVIVTIRDDGQGIAEGRLAEAAAAGRLGVAQSIRGRIAAVGGTVTIASSAAEGTEVQCRVPRRT
jgi:signal transduction histidine kinase